MFRGPRGRLFGSLCSLVFLVNFGRVVFAPLLEPLRTAFVLSTGTAGLLATLAWAGSAAPRLPTGYLLTRFPRHRVIQFTGGVLTLAAVLTAMADTVAVLAGGALLMGIASGGYFIAANPLVSELFPDRVGRAIGIHGTSSQVAAVAAPVGVTYVLARSWPIAAWRVVFLGIAAVAFLATVAFSVVARRADLPEAGTEDRHLLRAVRQQFPIVITGLAVIGATGFVWNAVFNLYVTYLIQAKGIPEATGRTLLTGVFLAGVPAFFVTGRLADRFPNVPLMLTVVGSFAVCLFALTAAQSFVAVAVVSIVTGYVIHSLFPAMDTYMLSSLPDEHRGSAYSVYSATMMLVSACGSVTVGTLTVVGYGFDAIYRTASFGLVLVLGVLVVLHWADWLPTGGRPAS